MQVRFLMRLLVASALIWPVVISLVVAVARLLAAVGDQTGARTLDFITLAAGMFWTLNLIGLVILLAAERAWRDDGSDESAEE